MNTGPDPRLEAGRSAQSLFGRAGYIYRIDYCHCRAYGEPTFHCRARRAVSWWLNRLRS